MKKTFALEHLDCATCIAKIETVISKLEGALMSVRAFLP